MCGQGRPGRLHEGAGQGARAGQHPGEHRAPTTVATPMILNEPTYRLFRPDLEKPTREDFEVAARTLNKLPVAAIEPSDISAIVYLVSDAGRYVTGITHVVDV